MSSTDKRVVCFVIMPFSKTTSRHTERYWKKHFKEFLKPLIEDNTKLEARRSEPLRGDLLKQIIEDLIFSPVVVADLTDHNPNVFWELGIRQSFKHGCITIAEKGTKLPFDLHAKGTLFYPKANRIEQEDFRRKFKKSIEHCITHPDIPDSIVLESISGRGTIFEIFRRDEAIRRLQGLKRECLSNIIIVKSTVKLAKENQEKPERRHYVTTRLRGASIDLLETTRYIEEEASFYNSLNDIMLGIGAINGQLDLWESSPNSVEKWVLDIVVVKKDYEKQLSTLLVKVEELIKHQMRIL